ncbi:MAG TPA: adenylate/guanylate cyclase domain-containing protein [Streptosporangiaceae bacterium]
MSGPTPTGTVTLLFTDIQGSTRLWEAEPDAMAVALRRHDEILRGSIEEAGGYVFKTVGDAFCATFWSADAALAAVLASQRLLGEEDWPTSRVVRVRMGLHTGVCEERDGDYFGPVVNRTARLEAVAYGGQVLLSGATAELAPEDIALRDLGLHRLKDLGRPEHVYQLEAEFLQPDFPPLASLDNPELPNNLPAAATPFVGREAEFADVRELLASARLVTLTGAGGSGKTRLALQVAAELLESAPDGVWLAELAPISDPGQVPRAVALALGLPDSGDQAAAITQALAGQRVVLVLDNCEHVIDAAAKFCDEVLRQCPDVRFLATSREPLGIGGETVYRVPSLSLPGADAQSAGELAGSDAVRLFVARAKGQDARFALDDAVAQQVATICRRLDGIPLALELAAARLSSMSLAQVAARLDQRFRLLTGGSRNAMPRQQTLQATVDWSFSLLNPAERETLTRLSVFVGGFELEAAETVCAGGDVDELDVMDLVRSLVDKSLVVADRQADSVRYRQLETIRQYCAAELLRAAGDDQVVRVRELHADYYLQLAETAGPQLRASEQGAWLRRLDREADNLQAALGHFSDGGRSQDVLRLTVAVARFVTSRGHAGVIAVMRGALAGQPPSALTARGHLAVAELCGTLTRKDPGQLQVIREHADAACTFASQVGDRAIVAAALGMQSAVAYIEGNGAGERLAQEALAAARESGDARAVADLAQVATLGTRFGGQESRSYHQAALETYRAAGDTLSMANELHDLAAFSLVTGDVPAARAGLEQAAALAAELGDEVFLSGFRGDLALVLLMDGEYAAAEPLVRHRLLLARRTGVLIDVSQVIFGAACVVAWRGDHERAARLFGAADVALEGALADLSIRLSEPERDLIEREHAVLSELMGKEPYQAAYQAGRQLSRVQATDVALGREAAGTFRGQFAMKPVPAD